MRLHEIVSGELTLLTGVSQRLQQRKMYRNNRIGRLRFRKPRFDNRRRQDGWLPPSIQHKIDSHLKLIRQLYELLPITKTVIEKCTFDIHKINNPDVHDYSVTV